MIKILTLVVSLLFSFSTFGQWTIENLSKERYEIGGAVVDDKIFFAGGISSFPVQLSNTVDIYNLTTGNWSTDTLSIPRRAMQAINIGDEVFFVGSSGISEQARRIDIYNNSIGEWSTMEIPNARFDKALAALNGKLFIGGDQAIDIYDTESDTWDTHTLTIPRSSMCAVTVNNKVIFAGGDKGGNRLNAVDIYDLTTDSWSQATLTIERSAMGCATDGKKAYFAGGIRNNFSATKIIDIYDTETGLWSIDSLSVARLGISAVTIDNLVLFAGGRVNGSFDTYFSTVDIFDSNTGEWSIENLSESKQSMAAVATDDRAYFAGGRYNNANTDKVEIFKPILSSLNDELIASSSEEIKVYPNPSGGMISLNFDESHLADLKVMDRSGRTVYIHNKNYSRNSILDLSHLPKGMYYVIIERDDNSKSMGKFSIQK